MHLDNLTGAKEDLVQANKLDPKSKEVREAYNEVARRISALKKSEQSLYKNMMKEQKSTFGPMKAPEKNLIWVKGPDGEDLQGEVMAEFGI